ncbi:hypothetical protein [Palleronia salina]|nr:hypothetical protein [Palleronia salina]
MLEEFGGNLARAGPFLDFTCHNYELSNLPFRGKTGERAGDLGAKW